MNYQKEIKKAIEFHGHLGPYLVLGLRMGRLALEKLKARKYFGLEAEVKGANQRPYSCLIDGIQISSGCTYGKGNIYKTKGRNIQVIFKDLKNKRSLKISLKKELIQKLKKAKNHQDSERLAKRLLFLKDKDLFDFS